MYGESLSKKILKGLLIAGVITIAASSPYFALQLPKILSRALKRKDYLKGKREQFNNAFYYLKSRGYLTLERRRGQIYISLTEKGKKKAGKYQVDDLKIKKPKKWDRKWRIVVFDIPNLTNIKREAFRGKLKELGFFKLQRSVWVCPYDCQKEIALLRAFFGLRQNQLKLIVGEIEQDTSLRKLFKIR